MAPDLDPARYLLKSGMHLVPLHPRQKRPIGNAWNDPANCAKKISAESTGYGLPLKINQRCSLDPDDVDLARQAMDVFGFDLDTLMDAGVRTTSTRPGSGGRSMFRDPGDIGWVQFRARINGESRVILELRAESANLQDVVPGLVYESKDGTECTQAYVNGRTYANSVALPEALHAWWARLTADHVFLLEQQTLFAQACGAEPVLSYCTGRTLPFPSEWRGQYNRNINVEQLLEHYGYVESDDGRWSPPTATGGAGVRAIPNKDGLWRSDHASDPLHGMFDSWAAFVILVHHGVLADAEAAMEAKYGAQAVFDELPAEFVESIPERPARNGLMGVHIRLRSAADMMGDEDGIKYLVGGFLEAGALGMIWGAPGTFKSFVAVDWGLCVASGTPWFGQPVTQGPVVYIAGEGQRGMGKRVRAWLAQNPGADVSQFYVSSGAVNATDPRLAEEIIAMSAEIGRPALVIIDTLHRNFGGGDENSAQDIGKLLDVVDRQLGQQLGATVILVHHAKKDGGVARGSSSIKGAIDFEFEVTREGEQMACTITCRKMKDAPMPPAITLTMTQGGSRVQSE